MKFVSAALILGLAFSSALAQAELLQKAVTSYASWKLIQDSYQKDCAGDAKKLSSKAMDFTSRSLRQLHIPSTIMFKAKLDPATLAKLEPIDQAAKTKALELIKVSKKLPMELAQKSTGLGLASEAQLAPEDFLQSFDYKKSCDCLRDPKNVAKDEAEYNKMTAQEFLVRTEHLKVKCFVESAVL